MESLTACPNGGRSLLLRFPSLPTKSPALLLFRVRPSPLPVLAAASSRDGPKLDKWDQMELKFGRLLGEDPKLTLAKIMARKLNPDVSYLDVEKSFRKNKGKLDEALINFPEDMNVVGQTSDSPESMYFSSQKGTQNLPRDGKLKLSRPMRNKGNVGIKTTKLDENPSFTERQTNRLQENTVRSSRVPEIALRKPSVVQGDDVEITKSSKLKIKPNLFLKMRKDSDENSSIVTLLKKPEVMEKTVKPIPETLPSTGSAHSSSSAMRAPHYDPNPNEMPCNEREMTYKEDNSVEYEQNSLGSSTTNGMMTVETDVLEGCLVDKTECNPSPSENDYSDIGLQPLKQNVVESHDATSSTTPLGQNSGNASGDLSRQASLLGKPQRPDSRTGKELRPIIMEDVSLIDDAGGNGAGIGHVISADQGEVEDDDWKRAEHLLHTGEKVEVELISCSGRGFVASFGKLIGFLPYRNLGAKWKFLAFESWLRKNGLEPSAYRQNLSILGSSDVNTKNPELNSSKSQETSQKDEEKLQSKMKFEDLFEAYELAKTKYLSSFIGQRIRVSVLQADRNSRRIVFSGRPKEKEELIEKKRSLMARLSVGDIVKCGIKKITYFGIFVEVEGVPALIHQSEVSWDATLDPSSYFKIGQIVEAKVHQLDYALERIALSLKEITPDPLMEALESVVGDHMSLGGSLQAAQTDLEWADVDSLIIELEKIDGVTCVSKGRFFLSPGLAPTFQVYMASMFDNKYKLLARYGNKVQEVLVHSSLDKEQMKATILSCTNRVS